MTVILRPEGLRWFTGSDDPTDLCAHGDYEFRINGLLQGTPQKLGHGRAHAEVLLEEGKAITCSEAGTELELVFTSEDSQGNAISKSWVWSCSACAFVAGTY